MRLIDADALAFTHDYVTANGEPCITKAVIDNAPTIDAVPIVRCKDCKFSEVFQNDSSGVMARYCKAFTIERMVADNDYCSYGEREEDVSNSR